MADPVTIELELDALGVRAMRLVLKHEWVFCEVKYGTLVSCVECGPVCELWSPVGAEQADRSLWAHKRHCEWGAIVAAVKGMREKK